MDYDANRINELLAQLQNSTAFQNVVTSNANQTPSLSVDNVSTPAPASAPAPAPAGISPQAPTSGSTVFDLLSRLNPGASSSSQPSRPSNESNEKPPTPVSVTSPGLDLRFMTVQQALPHISKLTARAEFRGEVKKIQEAQNQLEQSLYASQQDVMRKHEQRVAYAKNKANIVGVPLGDKESQASSIVTISASNTSKR
ncbi:hypothetical protein FRC11_004202 [Ceratobasidium sp. 423]|nr:hypothetical protein FRC11_004202 [Ceratobasidium sp. 423]